MQAGLHSGGCKKLLQLPSCHCDLSPVCSKGESRHFMTLREEKSSSKLHFTGKPVIIDTCIPHGPRKGNSCRFNLFTKGCCHDYALKTMEIVALT